MGAGGGRGFLKGIPMLTKEKVGLVMRGCIYCAAFLNRKYVTQSLRASVLNIMDNYVESCLLRVCSTHLENP